MLVGLGGLVALMRYQYRRFEKEKQKIQDEYREEQEKQALQVEQAKAALVQMQNEKLATDIAFKNQELASATMHLVQKGEVLHTIKQALDQILEKSPRPEVRKEIQGLINLMNFDNKIDEDWEQFSHHFDQVHVNFMERLRKKYPRSRPTTKTMCLPPPQPQHQRNGSNDEHFCQRSRGQPISPPQKTGTFQRRKSG
ncbi:MAG: hypothetical protein IPH36_13795 [Saprospiraceae bacterium]|nr:hypothetical protein [Saprospiraceae bacterium]